MKAKEQVTSLELSKKLKELGVKQESIFWWGGIGNMGIWCDHVKEELPKQEKRFTWYSAFTVAELGEMLPMALEHGRSPYYLNVDKYDEDRWELSYAEIRERCFAGPFIDTEANARAKMLIYLIENKLIKI